MSSATPSATAASLVQIQYSGCQCSVAIVRSLVNKEVFGAPADAGLGASFLAERASFPQSRLVAIEGPVDVIVMIDDMPLHGLKLLF